MVDKDKLWAKFEKSGKVSDYLEYCGIDIGTGVNAVAEPTEEQDETDHRRTDHTGKQQRR